MSTLERLLASNWLTAKLMIIYMDTKALLFRVKTWFSLLTFHYYKVQLVVHQVEYIFISFLLSFPLMSDLSHSIFISCFSLVRTLHLYPYSLHFFEADFSDAQLHLSHRNRFFNMNGLKSSLSKLEWHE